MTLTSAQRWIIIASVPVAAIGIALAKGKKPDVPVEAPPTAVAEPTAPVEPPPPALFPDPLPLTLTTLPPGLASLSAQTCNACHYAAHDTWQTSAHARAWTSDTSQTALRSAGQSTACLACHLPLASQHDLLAAGYVDGDLSRPQLQPNAAFDASLMSEGVTCAACHVRGDTILGTHASTNAPHRTVASAELSSPEMCATCHQLTWPGGDRPFYDTYGEWKASKYSTAGVTCQDCHMAPTTGATLPGSTGAAPSHASHADIARALTTLVTLPSATIQRGQSLTVKVSLLNTGAGHSVPTGNPFKTDRVEIAVLDAAGKDLAPPHTVSLARTVELVSPWKTTADHRLAAGGTLQIDHTFVPAAKGLAGRGAVEVRHVRGKIVTVLRKIPVDIK